MNRGQPITPNMIARNGGFRMDQGHPAMLRVVTTGNFGQKRVKASMTTFTSRNGAMDESNAGPSPGPGQAAMPIVARNENFHAT